MGKLLYLEPVGGIAGDMFLAAALDLGVPRAELERMLSGLALPPWRFAVSRSVRHAITGTHLDVEVDTPAHGHAHTPLSAIEALIRAAPSLPERVKARALGIFRVIGEAEAKIHDVPVETVEFHEVGAVDSIVDICGAACVLELLGDPAVYAAPPPLGSGTVKTAHGNLPVPPPATLEILKDVPVRFEGVGELTTPTGAAILKAVAQVGTPPELTVEAIGYGVGTKDFQDRPNVLRASLGTPRARAEEGGTWVLETNLDDASPQLLGALVERLLAEGALDAYVLPATMKKGRPGHLLGVVAHGERRGPLTRLLLTESTTLGVRWHRVERAELERRFETVSTRHGEVRIKLGLLDGQVVNAMPEYEDCRARSQAAQVPFKEVWAEALTVYRGRLNPRG